MRSRQSQQQTRIFFSRRRGTTGWEKLAKAPARLRAGKGLRSRPEKWFRREPRKVHLHIILEVSSIASATLTDNSTKPHEVRRLCETAIECPSESQGSHSSSSMASTLLHHPDMS